MDTDPLIPAPLPVLRIFREAFQFAWDKKWRMLRALSILMSVMFILEAIPYITSLNLESSNNFKIEVTQFDFVLPLISIPFYVLFVITCHRLALIGDDGVAAYGNLTWSKRETRFLWWSVVIPMAYLLLIILFPLAFSLLHGVLRGFGNYSFDFFDFVDSFWYEWFAYLLYLPSTYIIARLSLIFPATAVNRQVNTAWSWNLSKNNGWRLTVVVGIMPWVFALFQDLLLRENATLPEELTVLMIGLLLLAVEIVALSLSYKHLIENRVVEDEG